MKNFSGWFRQIGANFTSGMQRFMYGRYGHDRLNMTLLTVGLVLCIICLFVNSIIWDLILTLGSYALLIWAMVRCFSRNTYKRYQENRRFLLMIDCIKDRKNRYFTCPQCHQKVRVPRGKGRISITCPNPRCKHKFIKKT